jgi:hypothetical protein
MSDQLGSRMVEPAQKLKIHSGDTCCDPLFLVVFPRWLPGLAIGARTSALSREVHRVVPTGMN